MENVKLLEEGQEADDYMELQDQININNFSKLHSVHAQLGSTFLDSIEYDLDLKKKEVEGLEDALGELDMVLDEDELIPYKIGDVFMQMSFESVKSRLTERLEKVKSELEGSQKSMDETTTEMDLLKKALYSKFKDSINLDK